MMIKKLLIAGALSGGLVASAAGAAVASTSHHVSTARPAAAVQHVKAAEPSGEGSGESEGSTQGDGPGGHADQPGQNVNHQAQGTE